jgi:hypothetical protein
LAHNPALLACRRSNESARWTSQNKTFQKMFCEAVSKFVGEY